MIVLKMFHINYTQEIYLRETDMVATVTTLFNEFPLVFISRVLISAAMLFGLIKLSTAMYNRKRIDKIQKNAFIVLSSYTVVLLYFTVLGRYSKSYYRYETEIFAAYRQYFETADKNVLIMIIINLLMMIPISFLLCMVIKSKCKYLWVMLISVSLSLLIEVLQLVTRCGTFEVDDLINNTVSTVLGILIYLITKPFLKKLKRKYL